MKFRDAMTFIVLVMAISAILILTGHMIGEVVLLMCTFALVGVLFVETICGSDS
jgi:hypothetical protein